MYQGPTFPAPTSPLLQAPAKLRCLQTSVDLLIHQEGDQENYPSFLGKGHRMSQPLVFIPSKVLLCRTGEEAETHQMLPVLSLSPLF